jgi:hypothetical protein
MFAMVKKKTENGGNNQLKIKRGGNLSFGVVIKVVKCLARLKKTIHSKKLKIASGGKWV